MRCLRETQIPIAVGTYVPLATPIWMLPLALKKSCRLSKLSSTRSLDGNNWRHRRTIGVRSIQDFTKCQFFTLDPIFSMTSTKSQSQLKNLKYVQTIKAQWYIINSVVKGVLLGPTGVTSSIKLHLRQNYTKNPIYPKAPRHHYNPTHKFFTNSECPNKQAFIHKPTPLRASKP